MEAGQPRLHVGVVVRGNPGEGGVDDTVAQTPRTGRRDVDRLRTLGYPVNSSVGVAGGYQLGAGASLPPLILEDEEALAVALGLRTAAAGSVVGVEQAALRAMAPLAGHLRKVDANRCRLESGADSLWRLALFVSLIGEEFEVEDPPELVEELRKVGARVRRATAASKRATGKRRSGRG